jgi:PKD repeat protein
MSLRSSWMSALLSSSTSLTVTIPSGAAIDDIATVGIYTERGTAIPAVTPPDASWTAGPVTTLVASRGSLQIFWKRLTAAETGTWGFSLDLASAGAQLWSTLHSGRLKTGSPISISAALVQDRITQTGISGTALLHDDVIFGFNEWNGATETVSGFTKNQEDATNGAHLFTASNVSAGSITGLPSPASSANTYWYTLLSLKVAGLIANAGTDQSVQASATVTLSGSGSGGVSPYTYAWTQTSGTTVTLSSSTAQNPTFTAPATAGSLTFSLVVTDSASTASSPDTVNVTVSARPAGTPAGPVNTTVKGWSAATSAAVPLVAASTSGNSLVAILTVRNANVYTTPITDSAGNLWQLATSTRAVTGLGQPIREFIYYTSRAASVSTVTASFLDSSSAALSGSGVIHVLEFAGDLGAPTGVNQGGNVGTEPTPYGVTVGSAASAIVFGGLGLGVNNRVWSVAAGWTSSGHDGTQADVDQYVGYKIVTGPSTTGPSWTRTAGTQTDSTQVTIEFPGGVPVPQASGGAQQNVTVGAGVTLHGTATGGTSPYTYAWTQTQGPSVALSSNTAQNPTFTSTTVGTYWFQLVVTDSTGTSSAPATAVVVVSATATGTVLIRSAGAWVPAVIKVRSGGVWV